MSAPRFSNTLLAVMNQITRTLKHKWHWRRRKSVLSAGAKSRYQSTSHERTSRSSNQLISLMYSTLLATVLVTSYFIRISSAHPLSSKTVSRSPAVAAANVAATITSHQTECDWKGRGGIVASSSLASSSSSNVPPPPTSSSAAAINSHHHRVHYQHQGDSGDSDKESSSSANGQVIQSRMHEYEEDLLTSALVQTINLRCSSGQVHWEDPKGGLKISIHPSVKRPYRLCLENTSTLKSVRILLEQGGSLLPVLTTANSKCYQMYGGSSGDGEAISVDGPTVVYIEHSNENSQTDSDSASQSLRDGVDDGDMDILDDGDGLLINQNHLEDDFPHQDEAGEESDRTGNTDATANGNTISLSYEIESFRGDGDPCAPCSEVEVLKTYCTADAVVRGSILRIVPANAQKSSSLQVHNQADDFDSIYIKSTFVVHQTQPLFTHYNSLSHFLNDASPVSSSSSRFNTNRPQRLESLRGDFYGGVIHHPAQCASSIGDGEEFLWLIKFRFGRPITDCVIYWDSWVQMLQRNQAECPVSFG